MSDELNDDQLDITGKARQLAELMKEEPEGIDADVMVRGDRVLRIESNPSPKGKVPAGLNAKKIEVIWMAIEDLADRSPVLSSAFLALALNRDRLDLASKDYGQPIDGELLFSIGFRNPEAARRWKREASDEITTDDLHAGIYRLIIEWSRLL